MRTDLLETYAASLSESARRQYPGRVRPFLEWLQKREPDGAAVTAWLDRLRRHGYADGTLRQEFGLLRRLYRVNDLPWPFHQGEAPIVREMEVYAPGLAQEDIGAMVDVVLGRTPHQGPVAPEIHHRAFLCLSTVWGLRREEMAEMKPEFLDLRGPMLFVQTAKRGRQRWHLVPDFLLPHLEAWGFHTPLSPGRLTALFNELKGMIGFTGPESAEVGWHSIRRTAIKAAYEVGGFFENQISSFYRWKRSTSNMALRYGTARVVGRGGERAGIAMDDRRLDELFYDRHPFPKMWMQGVSHAQIDPKG